MAGTTLATAWVQIVPSLEGAGKQISSQLSKVNVSGAGKSIGSSLGSSIASGLGSLTKIAGTVGATLAGVVTGVAAKGGIDRALSIENAQAKLAGLGHDASSVSQIMTNALASVKGTVFGLGDAATVAASLSASGVQAGSQLETVLKTVADTAQISGRSLTDVGTIFASVAARGKLQGDDMLQLMSAGVPVLQLLAAHLGTTSAAVSDMVSKGQIDFQTFADAMQEGLGGAALAAGGTFTGALSNVKAALGRLGAGAATPVLNGLRELFNGLIPVIDQVTAALQPLFDALGSKLSVIMPSIVAGVQSATDALTNLVSGGFGGLGVVLAGLAPLIAGFMGFMGPLTTDIPVLESLFSGLTPAFGGVLGIVAALVATSPALQGALGALLGSLSQLVSAVLPALTPLLGVAVGAIQVAATVLAAVLGPIAGIIGWLAPFGDILGSLAVAVLAGVGAWYAWTAAIQLWQGIVKIGTAVQAAFNAVMSANPIMLVVIAIAALVAGLVWFFTQTTVGQQIWAGFMAWLQSAWQAIGDFFVTLWNGISSFVTGAINGIAAVIGAVTGAISGTWSAVWGGISSFFINIWNGIIAAVGWLGGAFSNVFGGISGMVSSAFSGVVGIVKGPINGIISLVNSAIKALNGISVAIPDWVPGMGGQSWGVHLPTIPMLATGGVIARGGWAVVGERGPELVNLPGRSTVYDADQSADALGGVSAPITVNTNDPLLAATVIAEHLRGRTA